MRRFAVRLLVGLAVCSFTPLLFGAAPGLPRTDAYGDALPEGAIARLGTLRYRPGSSTGAFGLSPDGKMIATGETGWVRLWDTATGKELHAVKLPEAIFVLSLMFSADSKRLAVRVDHQWYISRGPWQDESIHTIAVATGKVIFKVHEERIGYRQLAVTDDGKYLVASFGGRPEVDSEKEGTAHVWDVETGKEVNRLPPHIVRFALAPDGKTIALGKANGTIEICELTTGKEIARFKGHAAPIHALAFSPDGRRLASASGTWEADGADERDKDRSIRIWDIAGRKEAHRYEGHLRTVFQLAFTANGQVLIAEDYSRKVILWDTASGKEKHAITHQPKPSDSGSTDGLTWALAADGKTLVWCTGHDGVFHEWDIVAGKERSTWGGQQGFTSSLALTPDGKWLVSKGNCVCIWDVASGEEARPFEAHRAELSSLAFSPGGRYLASIDDGQGLRLWDASTGRPLPPFTGARLEKVLCFRFSSDSKLLTTVGTDAAIRVWDPALGWMIRQLDVGGEKTIRHWCMVTNGSEERSSISFQDGSSGAIAFDPSGRLLALSGPDRDIHVWDVAHGQEIGRLWGQRAPFNEVAFASEGKQLLSWDRAGGWRLWDLQAMRPLYEFQKKAGLGGRFAQSSDGNLLALGVDHKIEIWDLPGQKLRRELPGHLEGVDLEAVAFDRSGQTLASWGRDFSIRTWDTTTGRQLRAFSQPDRGKFTAVSFEAVADRKLLAKASLDPKHSRYGLLDLATGRQIAQIPGWHGRYAVSPDGRILVTYSGTVKLHEWASGEIIGELPQAHRGDVNTLAFSPDGKRLATGGADTSIVLGDWARAAGITPPPDAGPLDGLWNDLADKDAARAYRAVFALAGNEKTAAFLEEWLKPASDKDADPQVHRRSGQQPVRPSRTGVPGTDEAGGGGRNANARSTGEKTNAGDVAAPGGIPGAAGIDALTGRIAAEDAGAPRAGAGRHSRGPAPRREARRRHAGSLADARCQVGIAAALTGKVKIIPVPR